MCKPAEGDIKVNVESIDFRRGLDLMDVPVAIVNYSDRLENIKVVHQNARYDEVLLDQEIGDFQRILAASALLHVFEKDRGEVLATWYEKLYTTSQRCDPEANYLQVESGLMRLYDGSKNRSWVEDPVFGYLRPKARRFAGKDGEYYYAFYLDYYPIEDVIHFANRLIKDGVAAVDRQAGMPQVKFLDEELVKIREEQKFDRIWKKVERGLANKGIEAAFNKFVLFLQAEGLHRKAIRQRTKQFQLEELEGE